MSQTIMFFGAHADDMEVRAAGTLRKFVEAGYRGVSVMMTNNLCGAYVDEHATDYFTTGPVETQEIRHREAREAAALLGVELVFLDFKENSYFDGTRRVYLGTDAYDEKNLPGREPLLLAAGLAHCTEEVARLLVEYAPEIVITHSLIEQSGEHCAAARLTRRAFQMARRRARLRELWYACRVQDPADVAYLCPNVIVDITPYEAIKQEALRLHKSQRLNLERIRASDAYWAQGAGFAFAEAFQAEVRYL